MILVYINYQYIKIPEQVTVRRMLFSTATENVNKFNVEEEGWSYYF